MIDLLRDTNAPITLDKTLMTAEDSYFNMVEFYKEEVANYI
ncbi:hypothetical protein ABSA28_00252 [Candidatus Hepatincolaceae symbiont of Richtersius coronifer]